MAAIAMLIYSLIVNSQLKSIHKYIKLITLFLHNNLMEIQSKCPASFDNPFWATYPIYDVKGCTMFYIEKDKELIAYCFFEVESDEMVTIHLLEVHPDRRRKGLGTQLVKRIFDTCPFSDVQVFANHENSTQIFWRKHGFCMLFGYRTNCSHTPHLIRTKKDISSLYEGDDPIVKKFLGAEWSSTEKAFIPLSNN